MPRVVEIPAAVVTEEIQSLNEFLPVNTNAPGHVRVVVGRMVDNEWVVPQQFQTYEIQGAMYDQLVGDGVGWATPGKPVGTYRNEDLWHFIDMLRLAT